MLIDTGSFSTIRAGYRALLRWMRTHGDVRRVGIEGTGSYGAGITRHLTEAGVEVVEVNRPDRSDRRLRGKSDTLDAENAARAALAGQRTHTPKSKAGAVESLRVLRLTRQGAVKSRRATPQMLHNHIVSAPEELRDQLRNLTRMQLIRTCAGRRPDTDAYRDPIAATHIAIKSLARRILDLNDEIGMLDDMIADLVEDLAPELTATVRHRPRDRRPDPGHRRRQPRTPRQRNRLRHALRRRTPPSRSGKTQRHRLNRGGDR